MNLNSINHNKFMTDIQTFKPYHADALAGFGAGLLANFLSHPMDTLKIRKQLA